MVCVDYKIIVDDWESETIIIEDICKFNNRMFLSTLIENLKIKYNIPNYYCGIIYDLEELVWKKFDFKFLSDENSYYHYLGLSLKQLDSEFKLFSNQIEIKYIMGGIGSTMCVHNGVHIYFHTSEKDVHHIPHIHCKYNEIEYRVNLNTLEPIDSKLFKNPKLNKKVLKLIKHNKEGLLKYWDDVIVNGIESNFKMEII